MTPFITGRGQPGRDVFFENRDSSFQDHPKAYPVTRPKDRSQQFRYDWMSYMHLYIIYMQSSKIHCLKLIAKAPENGRLEY